MGTVEEASRAINLAREAARQWGQRSPEERAQAVRALVQETVRRRDALVELICAETGKTPVEALTTDLLPALECLRFIASNARRALAPRRVSTPFLFGWSRSRVLYRARGVILVIAPWNNPFQLGIVPIASAVVGGNAVILKPSERTPATGREIGALCGRAGFPEGLMQVVCGGAEAAEAFLDQGVDMVFFTGGATGGSAVLARAARHRIPAVMELGGKDPMIVFDDADLDRGLEAALYGAFAHAGQHCVSLKRLYVQESVYEPFVARLAHRTRELSNTDEWGRVMDERALDAARRQVQEALASGARLLAPADRDRACREPTLVADVSPKMALMQEETFAPVLAAMPFRDETEATALANDCAFGLNASVWTGNLARAERVIERLAVGNACVNTALVNAGHPGLPFGGVKASGFGRYHGTEGIRLFCQETSVMVRRDRLREPQWFPRGAEQRRMVEDLIELRYGGAGFLRSTLGWLRLVRRMIHGQGR